MNVNIHVDREIFSISLDTLPTTWGGVCKYIIEKHLTTTDHHSQLLFQMLTSLTPNERFTKYRINYGDGNSTIVNVGWSSTDVPGCIRLPLVNGYLDVNMRLKFRGERPIRDLYLCTVSSPSSASTDDHHPSLFPDDSTASVIYLREYEECPGYVAFIKMVEPKKHVDEKPSSDAQPPIILPSAATKEDYTMGNPHYPKRKHTQDEQPSIPVNTGRSPSSLRHGKNYAYRNKGGLKSFVDTQFSQKHPGVIDAGFKVLDYLYLHPSHAPSTEGPGICLAAESCYGNDAKLNLQRGHYLRQSFGKTDVDVDDDTRVCFVYGAGYGSVTFGTVDEHSVYREWTEEIQLIADAIEKELVNNFSSDKGVDITVGLNEMEVVSFYDSKRITFHRDQSYSEHGEFMANNCQKQHTCTCIFVLGDDRVLEFQAYLNKKKEVDHPEAKKSIRLTNGGLFFLHPEDEADAVRELFEMDKRSHFKHRNNGVVGNGQLSVGLIFRTCVQTRTVYKGTGQLVLDSEPTNTAILCEQKLNEYLKCWTKNLMDDYLKKKYLAMKERHYKRKSTDGAVGVGHKRVKRSDD